MIINKDSLDAVLNIALAKHNNRIGQNDRLFLRRIYGDGLTKYQDRLNAIGFSEYDHVLDAGCGYGQWSLALAEMNRKVSSCDISSLRIDLLSDLTKKYQTTDADSSPAVNERDIHLHAVNTFPSSTTQSHQFSSACHGPIRSPSNTNV